MVWTSGVGSELAANWYDIIGNEFGIRAEDLPLCIRAEQGHYQLGELGGLSWANKNLPAGYGYICWLLLYAREMTECVAQWEQKDQKQEEQDHNI